MSFRYHLQHQLEQNFPDYRALGAQEQRLKVDVTRPVQIAFADGAKKNYEIVNIILYDGAHYTNRQSTPDGWKEVNNHFVEDVRLCNIGDFPRAVIRHLLLREASDQ